jgi:hypothetical protein
MFWFSHTGLNRWGELYERSRFRYVICNATAREG